MANPLSNMYGSKTMRLHLLTWNVGQSKPDLDFAEVLDFKTVKQPDVYMIGLQEVSINDLSMEEHPWSVVLTECLGKRGYVRLKVRRMRGVMTIVFAKRCHLPFITSIESEATKTGFGGWWGNKGGASIRLDLYGMNLILVNAHLAAHKENVAERIVDFNSILDDQKFKDEDVDNILDHDYVFWIGDLNFRLSELSYDETIRYICNGDVRKLLTYDELIQCKEERLILEDFQEGKISFAPTYKFDKGTDTYDTSKKRRVPAWCDRILYHVYPESYGNVEIGLKQINYKSHQRYQNSDHKPVTSLVDIQVFENPILPPVKFGNISSWYTGKEQKVSYSITTKSFSSDWIGLYKADFTNFHAYVEFIWAEDGAEKKDKKGTTLTFPAEKLQVDPGKYCLCYLTRKYSLQGISEEFVVV